MGIGRVQRGVPTGGQFAAQHHAETQVSLGGSNSGDIGSADTRQMVLAAVDDTLWEIDSTAIEQFRVADDTFPQGDFDEAVHTLQVLREDLGGNPAPPAPNKVANAISTYRQRLAARRHRRPAGAVTPVADLREQARAALNSAVTVLADDRAVEQARSTPGFPMESFERSIRALNEVKRRVDATPPPARMRAPALSAWQSQHTVNPSFASFNAYNPMAVAR